MKYINEILLFITFFSLITAICCYVKYRKIEVHYKEKKKKYYYITSMLLVISFISICVCIYNKSNDEYRKKLSHLLLGEKDERNFIRYCDELFQIPDGEYKLVQQYNSVKQTGSLKQRKNICESYARELIK